MKHNQIFWVIVKKGRFIAEGRLNGVDQGKQTEVSG